MAAIGGFPGQDNSHELRVYQGTYEPARHYGFHAYRTDQTVCGKPHTDVVFTFNREHVTCDTCIDELNVQDDVPEENS